MNYSAFLQLSSLALALPRVRSHPNRQPFRGVLTLVDSPSDRPPAGARGHRVILTRAAAERAIPSLLGMGLDFTAAFDGHDARRKVGIITSAEIVSRHTVEAQGSVAQGFSPEYERSEYPAKQTSTRIRALAPASLKGHAFRRATKSAEGEAALAAEANSKLETRNSKLDVTGFLFARDFPDVVREIA